MRERKDYKNNFNNLKQNQTLKHHWCEFNKRLKDVKYLEKVIVVDYIVLDIG